MKNLFLLFAVLTLTACAPATNISNNFKIVMCSANDETGAYSFKYELHYSSGMVQVKGQVNDLIQDIFILETDFNYGPKAVIIQNDSNIYKLQSLNSQIEVYKNETPVTLFNVQCTEY